MKTQENTGIDGITNIGTSTNSGPENHLIYTDPHILIRQNQVDQEIKKELKKINKNLKKLNEKPKRKKNKKKDPVIITGDEVSTEDTPKPILSRWTYPIDKSGPIPTFNPKPKEEAAVEFSNADLLIGHKIIYTIKENPHNEDGYFIKQEVYEI